MGDRFVSRAASRSRRFLPDVAAVESRLLLSTFTVTSANDFDNGSLRDAIFQANADPGPNTIAFDLPGFGPHVIKLAAPLPAITTPVTIDGYTQPGSAPNTAATGDNAHVSVVLDGSGIGKPGRVGLQIKADNSTVRGLSVINFDAVGVLLAGSNDRVEGSYIGVDSTGATAGPNGLGVAVNGGGDVIGGAGAAARNVVSGNLVGVGLANVTLGGKSMVQHAAGGTIQNNLIGTDSTGAHDLGNSYVGVALVGSGNVVGGTAPGQANTIAYNGKAGAPFNLGAGVLVAGLKPTSDAPAALVSSGNLISGNALYGNQTQAISQIDIPMSALLPLQNASSINFASFVPKLIASVETNATLNVSAPVLTSALVAGKVTTIQGTLAANPNTAYRVQFFAGTNTGQAFLGQASVTTDAAGHAAVLFAAPMALPAGQSVTATAIAPDNSTSQVSAAVAVSAAPPSLAAIGDQTVTAGDTVRFTAVGTDPDPTRTLTYSASAGTIDPKTGAFTYAATTGPLSQPVTITVHDNATPALSASRTFTITVLPRPVQVTSIDVSVAKKLITKLVVHFNGAVTGADNAGLYHLALVRTKKVKGKAVTVTKNVGIKSVSYDGSGMTATITPAGKLAPKKVNQLVISAAGIRDAIGRPLDGNRDGTPGGDLTARIAGNAGAIQ